MKSMPPLIVNQTNCRSYGIHGSYDARELVVCGSFVSGDLQPGLLANIATRKSAGDGHRRGVVLIVVLVLVMMVALAGFGFLAAMSTEYEAARMAGSMRQAKQTMASAESTLLWFAGLSDRDRTIMGGWYHNPALFRAHVVEPLKEMGTGDSASPFVPGSVAEEPANAGVADARWRFSIESLDRTPEQTRVKRFGLQNESARVNLASILRWEQASPGQGRASLMQLPGMTEPIADAILDWLDADEQTREFGAETEYYQTLNRPYRAANTVPKDLTELLYVKGVTRRLLMGTPQTSGGLNSQLPQAAESSLDANGDLASNPATAGAGWVEFMTVHSAERDLNRSGQRRVFLNADSLSDLESQLTSLTAALPEELVRYILLVRVYGLTISAEASTGVEPSTAPFASSMLPAFRISSLADLIDSTVQVTSGSGTVVVQSPLQSAGPEFAALAASLCDLTTTHPEAVIYGRVNLRLASETVLRMIPGLTPELVTQLVTQRDTLEASQADQTVWLLSGRVLDLPTFRRVFPEVTTGGDVFQSEILIYRTIGGPTLRGNLILDAASNPPRRVHWVDLTDSGRP